MRLITQLFSVSTLHVAVPVFIPAEAFNKALEDYYSRTPGYEDIELTGLVIEASDLPGMIESDPEDIDIKNFFLEVNRLRGDADRIYFHRAPDALPREAEPIGRPA